MINNRHPEHINTFAKTIDVFEKNLSQYLKNCLGKECWYHGTNGRFDNWQFPPPVAYEDRMFTPHQGMFFSTDRKFAKGAGNNLSVSKLLPNIKILDATENYKASEAVRKLISGNPVAALTINIEHDIWHQGWKDGTILKVIITDDHYYQICGKDILKFIEVGYSEKDAIFVVNQNLNRSFIELICNSTKLLGFDALFGHEVDNHACEGVQIARTWLAVLREGVISSPKWL